MTTTVKDMLRTHPAGLGGVDPAALERRVEERAACAQACRRCADACRALPRTLA
ncbi:four-helix bundle copper-binding protein [Streptomyces buecherae]|uniref:four-helix bundle copper-binding protein n=1 Tax=Streptomyces buecherae TaxID=2763006 RepID=UPI0036D0466C